MGFLGQPEAKFNHLRKGKECSTLVSATRSNYVQFEKMLFPLLIVFNAWRSCFMSSADVSSSISVISTYVSRLQGNEKIMNQINASLSGEERHVSLKKVKAREILYANGRNMAIMRR